MFLAGPVSQPNPKQLHRAPQIPLQTPLCAAAPSSSCPNVLTRGFCAAKIPMGWAQRDGAELCPCCVSARVCKAGPVTSAAEWLIHSAPNPVF